MISNLCQILETVWKDDGRRARRVEWALDMRSFELYSMHVWCTLSLGSNAASAHEEEGRNPDCKTRRSITDSAVRPELTAMADDSVLLVPYHG